MRADPSHSINPKQLNIYYLIPWLQEIPQEYNAFVYTLNNPVNRIDANGLKGCGPGSGWGEKIIPEKFFIDVSSCCNDHDDCYGCKGATEGKSKLGCDWDFCKCLMKKCFSTSNVFQMKFSCPALGYCGGVVLFGDNSFSGARVGARLGEN